MGAQQVGDVVDGVRGQRQGALVDRGDGVPELFLVVLHTNAMSTGDAPYPQPGRAPHFGVKSASA
jgi:hypothetical protein